MPVYSVFGRLFQRVFSSRKLIDSLGAQPIVGNLVIAALVAGTGLALFGAAAKDNRLSASDICNTVFIDEEGKLQKEGNEVVGLSAKRVLSDTNKKIVTCSYEVEAGLGTAQKVFDVVYRVPDNELIVNVEEKAITEADLESICRDESVYKATDKKTGKPKISFSPSDSDIELVFSTSFNTVYPVYRWRCLYHRNSESIPPLSNAGQTVDLPPVGIGINLDQYCQDKYGEDSWIGAFHHYDDPRSWHCTDPNF